MQDSREKHAIYEKTSKNNRATLSKLPGNQPLPERPLPFIAGGGLFTFGLNR
jgi:hypothetical protein